MVSNASSCSCTASARIFDLGLQSFRVKWIGSIPQQEILNAAIIIIEYQPKFTVYAKAPLDVLKGERLDLRPLLDIVKDVHPASSVQQLNARLDDLFVDVLWEVFVGAQGDEKFVHYADCAGDVNDFIFHSHPNPFSGGKRKQYKDMWWSDRRFREPSMKVKEYYEKYF